MIDLEIKFATRLLCERRSH